jgi:hypothetical protein
VGVLVRGGAGTGTAGADGQTAADVAAAYDAFAPFYDAFTADYNHDSWMADVEAWARDALVFALPQKILCRPECAGLCPRCGERLEQGVEHHCGEEETDPRWDKLRSWGESGV